MNPVEVTIIIPVYNTPEQYLRKCLDSALKQSIQNIEVIAVDDGSTDKSGQICDEIAAGDKRLKVIHTENMGVSNARNVGIEQSNAPFILFLDADDNLEADTCEKCLSIITKTDDDIVFYKPVTQIADTGLYESKDKSFIRSMQIDIIRHTDNYAGFVYGSPWGKVFRRDFLNKNALRFTLGVKRSQDRLFMLYCLEKADSVGLFHYSGYHYVRNNESICNKYNEKIVGILDNATKHINDFVVAYHANDAAYQEAMHQLRLKFAFTEMQLYYLNSQRGLSIVDTGKQLRDIFSEEPLKTSIEHLDLKYCYGKIKVVYMLIERKHYYLAVIAYRIMNYGVKLRDMIRKRK